VFIFVVFMMGLVIFFLLSDVSIFSVILVLILWWCWMCVRLHDVVIVNLLTTCNWRINGLASSMNIIKKNMLTCVVHCSLLCS